MKKKKVKRASKEYSVERIKKLLRESRGNDKLILEVRTLYPNSKILRGLNRFREITRRGSHYCDDVRYYRQLEEEASPELDNVLDPSCFMSRPPSFANVGNREQPLAWIDRMFEHDRECGLRIAKVYTREIKVTVKKKELRP